MSKINDLIVAMNGIDEAGLEELNQEIESMEKQLEALCLARDLFQIKLGKKKKPTPKARNEVVPPTTVELDDDEVSIGNLIRTLGPMSADRIAKATGMDKEHVKEVLSDDMLFVKEPDGWHLTNLAMQKLLDEEK